MIYNLVVFYFWFIAFTYLYVHDFVLYFHFVIDVILTYTVGDENDVLFIKNKNIVHIGQVRLY